MAQWIAHQTSNLGVAGSNPVEYALFILPMVFCFCCFSCSGLRFAVLSYHFASIAQLAEHVLRKHKVTSSILVGGLPVVTASGRWSRGMILPSGGRGRGFDSRTAPDDLFCIFFIMGIYFCHKNFSDFYFPTYYLFPF